RPSGRAEGRRRCQPRAAAVEATDRGRDAAGGDQSAGEQGPRLAAGAHPGGEQPARLRPAADRGPRAAGGAGGQPVTRRPTGGPTVSQQEPTKAYVYQPEPAGSNGGYIYAVSGPGTEGFREQRFASWADVDAVAESINRRQLTSDCLKAPGRTRSAKAAVR